MINNENKRKAENLQQERDTDGFSRKLYAACVIYFSLFNIHLPHPGHVLPNTVRVKVQISRPDSIHWAACEQHSMSPYKFALKFLLSDKIYGYFLYNLQSAILIDIR